MESNKDRATGVGWGFLTIGVGLIVLVSAGLELKDDHVSFNLDEANESVVRLSGFLILSGAGIRVMPEKSGRVLPTTTIATALGTALLGESSDEEKTDKR